MQHSIEEFLHIGEVAKDHLVSKLGDITYGYRIIKPGLFTLSPEGYHQWCNRVLKGLEVLPPDTILHFVDRFWQISWQGNFENGSDGLLAISSERHHHERPFMEQTSYLYITRRPKRRRVMTRKMLLRKHFSPQDTLSSQAKQELRVKVNQFIQILTDGGQVRAELLAAEDFTGTPEKPGLIEEYYQLIKPGERRELRDIEFGEKVRIGNNFCMFHSIADPSHLPAQCRPWVEYGPYSTEHTAYPIGNASWLGALVPRNHIYNQILIKEDPAEVRKKLERKRRLLQSLSAHSRENALTCEAVTKFLDESMAGDKQIVSAHFNIQSWTNDISDVPGMSDEVSTAIGKTGATPYLETVGAPQLWSASAPGNAADLPPEETYFMLAHQAVCMLLPETNYLESPGFRGVRLGDRLHGRPLQVDLSDEPKRMGWIVNLNKIVIGPSGSGKSFAMNLLLYWYAMQGFHIVIVDIGNSYRGLCELVGGYYFTYTDAHPLSFNPFRLGPGEILDTEKKESLKALLLTLWKKEDEAFIRSEYVALSNAVQLYYGKWAADKELFPCFDSFYEFLRDEFVAILASDKVKAKDFDLENMLYVLRPFYKGGEFDFLLNAREQLDLLQQPFVVFEIDNVKDHPILFPVVTIVIMEVFIGKMRKLPGLRKVIIIEEAWKAIARQGMSEFMRYLFKTVRKFNGEAIVVTQEVEDIISSPVVKQAILNNADCKILLDLNKYRNRFDELQQVLGLTDMDKAMVLSLNQHRDLQRKYKEVFISLGTSCSRVYRVEVSLEEHLTFTTDETEKVRVQEFARKYGSLQKGIAVLAASIRDGSVKWLLMGAMMLLSILTPSKTQAQFPIAEIINMAVKRVIVATDLAIQRLQTQTIGLQNAQKSLENIMQLERLTDIADWVRQQKQLFAGYYRELWEVKNALTSYHRVKDLVEQQAQLVKAYQKALSLFRQDPHFSAEELEHMGKAYGILLDQNIRNVGELTSVVTGFVTQMQDGDRLAIIDRLWEELDQQRRDFLDFTQDNILLSLQRSKSRQEIRFIQILYNIH
ncbi:TraG family conjugative transposon ATPase [Flavitalea sp. BT771]|uniref:TraG family conjugative transposon ATPase n=1 Tax=Flavitalea sp. BT771 TaxID=3063329 RepID=UPI0026E45D73|nr:TraG family conjugative transposon ATPase [Flavitalea sp. BT771]MDO6433045.1 TraG family conjugative transposon ATPase [Flavitalea sp. BT771]MDV6221679.1 TraG family conjugative transposon ATPase [Flavitalea sp. BT771]